MYFGKEKLNEIVIIFILEGKIFRLFKFQFRSRVENLKVSIKLSLVKIFITCWVKKLWQIKKKNVYKVFQTGLQIFIHKRKICFVKLDLKNDNRNALIFKKN